MPWKPLLAYLEHRKNNKNNTNNKRHKKTENIKIKIFFGCPFWRYERQLLSGQWLLNHDRICWSSSSPYNVVVVVIAATSAVLKQLQEGAARRKKPPGILSSRRVSVGVLNSIASPARCSVSFSISISTNDHETILYFAQKINNILPTTVFGFASP